MKFLTTILLNMNGERRENGGLKLKNVLILVEMEGYGYFLEKQNNCSNHTLACRLLCVFTNERY